MVVRDLDYFINGEPRILGFQLTPPESKKPPFRKTSSSWLPNAILLVVIPVPTTSPSLESFFGPSIPGFYVDSAKWPRCGREAPPSAVKPFDTGRPNAFEASNVRGSEALQMRR